MSNDSFSRETRNVVLNRWSKQAITNFFSFPGNCCTNGMECMYILNTWITINFSSNTTQRVIIQCNVLYRGKYTMKNFISLDVPFQIPKFKWLRELKQATSTKAHIYTDVFMLAVSAVFCLPDLNNSIPNGSLIAAKGKRRKNTNVSLRNVKK